MHARSPERARKHAHKHFRTDTHEPPLSRMLRTRPEAAAKQVLYTNGTNPMPAHAPTLVRLLVRAHARAWALASRRRCVSTSAPGLAHICAGTHPRLRHWTVRLHLLTSAPGLRPRLRRDWLAHICAGARECSHLRRFTTRNDHVRCSCCANASQCIFTVVRTQDTMRRFRSDLSDPSGGAHLVLR